MTPATFLLAASLFAAGVLVYQLGRLIRSLLRGRRNIEQARASRDHPAFIRLFVEAQTKLLKLDAMVGVVLAVGLMLILGLARQAIIMLGRA